MSNEAVKKKSPKSTIIKDTVILFAITLVAGLLLGLVYEVTAPIIAERRLQMKMNAYISVYQEASNITSDESLTEKANKAVTGVLSENGYNAITIDEALIAVDDDGNKIGYVLSVSTQKGYSGNITLSFGYSLDGVVTGLEFLEIKETAGLGSKAAEPSFIDQFVNKQVEKFTLSKNAKNVGEVDALSSATITSEAVLNAVNAGICFITKSAEVD